MGNLEDLAGAARESLAHPRGSPPARGGPGSFVVVVGTVGVLLAAGCLAVALVFVSGRVSKGSVSGAVWVTRANGSSDVQRGTHVYLLRPTVSAGAVAAGMKARIQDVRARAERLGEQAKGHEEDTVPYWAVKEFKAESAMADSLQSTLATLPATGQMLTTDGFKLLCGPDAPAPFFDDIVAASMISEVVSDVDGKYAFPPQPRGDYVVFAFIGHESFAVCWAVPVRVDSAATKADLFNDNAINIRNFR